jgi:hypothetical protein
VKKNLNNVDNNVISVFTTKKKNANLINLLNVIYFILTASAYPKIIIRICICG